VHDLPSNQQQLTHVWKPSATFANLTIEEIHASVERAQEVNHLLTLRQAYNAVPMLDTLVEQWLPGVKDTEIPQVTDNNPDLEVIDELLKQITTSQELLRKMALYIEKKGKEQLAQQTQSYAMQCNHLQCYKRAYDDVYKVCMIRTERDE